ncbi:CCR4-NOT transcription complex subunit 10 [Acipenser ruthenus]|uniref:CCR4-NOT transcription complex subunit 10 n=1 Tax=Acipenser ruthenus TaxID=7906 RepID=A0A444UFZ8_ACIRT|nr:CCR4-NOT transcription complex subunit 10 [Acipenser ruthenus]
MGGVLIIDIQSGNYDTCLQHLTSLQEVNKDDYKIAMNKAIAEFYKSGQTTTVTLKQILAAMKTQVHAAVEEIDGLDDVENSFLYYNQAIIHYHMCQYTEAITIGEKLYQFLEPFVLACLNNMKVHAAVEEIDGLDDVENSFLYYNQAIIHYHMCQYTEAITIGEKLYQFLEPFEEKFAQAVCFLLVDLYLLTFQPEKALHLIAVLEKLTIQGNNKNGKNETANKEGSNQKAEYIAMFEAAKSKIHQYKVRAYIQMKSLKTCKREIKSVMNTAGNSAPSLFLKSNFEYLRGNYRKAVKLLNSSNIAEHPGVMKTGECVRCMFWNNLGCIHFSMGKHNLGIFYFKKALQENDHTCSQLAASGTGQAKKFSSIPMCTLLANKRYELLYNCGIQLLHIGRPLAAFECLIEAVQVYHSNPRLWLRLAECCVAANKGGLQAVPIRYRVSLGDGQSAAIPVASMEFAAICLRNALLLLPEDQQEAKSENGSKNSSQSSSVESSSEGSEACSGKGQEGDKFIPSPPSSPLRKQELENLRCSVLACSAYVALALGDNLLALNHAEKLLQQLKLSGSLKFLGHLYAAEALISLDRISDAISHLNPENVTDVSLGISSNEQDQGSDKGENEPMESSGKQTPLCYPNSVTSARAMMLFNLGSAYCLRSEYEKARKCLHQAASMVQTKEIPPEAILLAVYLELQNGNTQLALQIIKRNQLLPSIKTLSPDVRKKPAVIQPIQPIQMPAFTTVQRK